MEVVMIVFSEQNDINACATAMFMWEGVMLATINENNYTFYEVWGKGVLELAQELARYAVFSEQELLLRNPEDYPGVYDYEVSIDFGHWFAQHIVDNDGAEPQFEKGCEELKRRMDEFFNKE
jgi:hypothetical protein